MRVFKIALVTLVVSVLALGAAAAGIIYSGAYNVAATSEHWPVTRWALSQTVHRSIEQQATGIDVPELGSEDQLLAGAANFDAMCSGCHAPPGAKPSPAARGMYPAPPDLAHAGEEMAANEIYWVLKHGIKASGMPAWGPTHGDDELWAMTAFVKQWPDMSAADYDQLLAAAESSEIGHGHDGGSHDEGHSDSHGEGGKDSDSGGHGHGDESHQDGGGGGQDNGHTDANKDTYARR